MRQAKTYRVADIQEPVTAAAVYGLTHKDNGYHIDDRYGRRTDTPGKRADIQEVVKCNVQE